MKIYESNNKYYKKKNNKYIKCDVIPKVTTIVIYSTDKVEDNISIEKEYSFQQLKKKILGGIKNGNKYIY